jgi:type I restriction enzyme M protein
MTRPIRLEHLQPCRDWWGGAGREGRTENEVAWKVTIGEIKARNYNLDFKNPHTVEENHGDPAALLAKLEESEGETAKLRDRLKSILAEALLR